MGVTSVFGVTYIDHVDRAVNCDCRRRWYRTVSLELPFRFSATIDRINVTFHLQALVKSSTEHFLGRVCTFWKINMTIRAHVNCAVIANGWTRHRNIAGLDLPTYGAIRFDCVEVSVTVGLRRTYINEAVFSKRR